MFCPSNETLQTLSVKTKLLAQKCTQQIRAQHQCVSSQKKDNFQTVLLKDHGAAGIIVNESNIDKPTFRCFCPCKPSQETSKTLSKKSSTKDVTTKWYVKVITLISLLETLNNY